MIITSPIVLVLFGIAIFFLNPAHGDPRRTTGVLLKGPLEPEMNCDNCQKEITADDFHYHAELPFATRDKKKGEDGVVCDDCQFALTFADSLS